MKERFRFIAAVHLFLLKDDEILLQKRFNTGFVDGKYSVIDGPRSTRRKRNFN
jgi:hypothetical protein